MKPSCLAFFDLVITLAFAVWLLAGCATSPSGTAALQRRTPASQSPGSADSTFAQPPPEERPGLATGWGERRDSHVATTEFHRANGNTPAATGLLYYNDREGTQAMLAQSGARPTHANGLHPLPSGFVSIGIQKEDGSWLEGWSVGWSRHLIGGKGDRYAIVVRNETLGRIEIVTSVDGLDVLDGKPASYRKRGYILDAGETYAIEGFRTDDDSVAAFRFSSVSQSYAALKSDDTRNVGAIGIAVYAEKNQEVVKRRHADPFPRSWAMPPWN